MSFEDGADYVRRHPADFAGKPDEVAKMFARDQVPFKPEQAKSLAQEAQDLLDIQDGETSVRIWIAERPAPTRGR